MPTAVASVALSPGQLSFTGPGQTQTLTATPSGPNGQPLDRAVTFSSSDPSVATVGSTGNTRAVVTSVGAGSTTITASIEGRTATATAVVSCSVRAVTVTPNALPVLFVGGAARHLTAAVETDLTCDNAVQWSSTDVGIASVDATGNVTAVAEGTATIIARSREDNTKSASVPVTVARVSAINLEKGRDTIVVGQQRTLSAATVPAGGVVRWESRTPAVATVTAEGVVSGLADGEATLVARAEADPSKTASVLVRVRGHVTSVRVNPATLVVNVNQTSQLAPVVTADPGVNQAVTWTSSDASIATVSSAGVVAGIAHGSVTITATAVVDPTKQATASVDVRGQVRAVTVSPSPAGLRANTTLQLTATVDADPGVSPGVSWTTGNAAVATVSQTGLVTGVSDGTTTITAKSLADPSRVGSAQLTVGAMAVTIAPRTPSVAAGSTVQLTATVTGPPGVNPTLTWTSRATTVATVGATGLVTGVSAGTAWVLGQAVHDALAKDSVLVTVTACVPSAIVISPSPLVPMGPGATRQLAAQTLGCTSASPIKWQSGSPGVATVSGTGLLTAVSRGTAVIRAELVANPGVGDNESVQVIDVTSLTVTPTSDSVRVGTGLGTAFQRQLAATMSADPGVPLTVTWSSSNASVATVDASGLVTGVSDGTATITATSTFNPARVATSTIKVADGCAIPHMMGIGQSITAAISMQSCNQRLEFFGMKVGTPQAWQATATAPFNFQFSPLTSSAGTFFWTNLAPGNFSTYVAAAAGTYRAFVVSSVANTFGQVTLATTPWNMQGCASFIATTNLTFPALPLNAACGSHQRPGTPVGTYYTQFIDLLPYLNPGETITISAAGTGVQPHLELFDDVVVVASAGTGGATATITYSPASVMQFRLRVSTIGALQAGTVHLTITGPNASLSGIAGMTGVLQGRTSPGTRNEPACKTKLCELITARGTGNSLGAPPVREVVKPR